MCPIFPSQLPLPLVTLRLSTHSILDTVLVDAQDAIPLFNVESRENRTTVHMCDPRKQQQQVASIRWPVLPYGASRTKESPLVTVLGDTQTASSFLKKKSMLGGCVESSAERVSRSNLSDSSRKFHIPGQQHPLKWKHVGERYECTLCSHACTAHRAVATFEPAHTTSAARLAIYTSTVSNTLPTSEYRGIDVDMMVYLIITTILLSTQHTSNAILTPVSPIQHHQHPSPISSMGNYKIDLLAPDEAFVPFSSRNSPSSSSSCYSSLPASPISPATDLSSINNETFASTSTATASSSSCPMLIGRRQSTRHSSPRSGPTSITPYHLPPASPPTLRLQVPSPRVNNNALLLDTSAPNFYSHEQHHIQYSDRHHHYQYQHQHHLSPTSTAPSSYTVPPPPTEELPPAYSEIEWTVRVKQPRQALHTGLAY
jgi:hypothetical protein